MYVPFDEFIGFIYLFTGQEPIIAKYQLSPTCTLLASPSEFSGHFLQTIIINGGKSDSKILHLYLG